MCDFDFPDYDKWSSFLNISELYSMNQKARCKPGLIIDSSINLQKNKRFFSMITETPVCSDREDSSSDEEETEDRKLKFHALWFYGWNITLQKPPSLLSHTKMLSCITDLRLTANTIGRDWIKTLAHCMPPRLRILVLWRNELDDECLRVLGAHLPSTLQKLALGMNSFTALGLRALVTELALLPSFRSLNLGDLSLDTKDLAHLLPGFLQLRALEHLEIVSSDLGAEELRSILSWVPSFLRLRALDVSGNGATGIKEVLAAAKNSTSLDSLALVCEDWKAMLDRRREMQEVRSLLNTEIPLSIF